MDNLLPGNSRSSRSDLQYRLKYGPSYPVLGLEYITEYVNPGNPNKDPMYTCSLEVCKSAWGTASEIYNHLTTNKNKHNRRYLEKFYDIPNLTLDQIFNKSRQVFDEKKAKNNGKFDYHIKQITNVKEYSELKNRPLGKRYFQFKISTLDGALVKQKLFASFCLILMSLQCKWCKEQIKQTSFYVLK